MPASVTPEYLLEGAAYALEQCGLLLRDANVLYENGSYASAVALAAFAREELGRSKILRKLRTKVLSKGRLTIKDIQDACKDHEDKQRAGVLSTTIRADTNTELGKLLQATTGTCVYRKSDSAILVMKTAEDRSRCDNSEALNRARERGIFAQ
jgi:AbiV family abortive infection protein